MIPPGVRAAIAQARLALDQAKQCKPVKDHDQLLEDVDAWRETTYESARVIPSSCQGPK